MTTSTNRLSLGDTPREPAREEPEARRGPLYGAPRRHGIEARRDSSPMQHSAAIGQASADSHPNWETLLNTVRNNVLGLAFPDNPDAAPNAAGHGGPDWDPARIPGCVAELDRLHATLKREFGACRQIERILGETRAALARANGALTGSQAAAASARHDALHDGLTGLPNRRLFLHRLATALADSGPRYPALAVLYIDLDGFKPVNDINGHLAGDTLLRIVAARLSRMVRAEDTMSRLGGDEFACVIAGSSTRDELAQLAGKLVDAVCQPVTLDTLTLSVRPSIGIATHVFDGASAEQLLNRADQAMYHAKRFRIGYAFHDWRLVP